MTETRDDPTTLFEAVLGHFMATGMPATVTNIAARCGVSESTVRKRLRADGFGIPLCDYDSVEYEARLGVLRLRDAWVPSREALRYEIYRLRG